MCERYKKFYFTSNIDFMEKYANIHSYTFVKYHENIVPVIVPLDEPVREKTNNLGSDQVRHKPGCTVTEES